MRYMTASAAIAVLMMVDGSFGFADKKEIGSHQDGRLISISEREVVLDAGNGANQLYPFASNVRVTLDGKTVPWNQLKPGTRLRVNRSGKDKATVNWIEAIAANRYFSNDRVEAELVRISDKELVVTCADGKERTLTMASNAKLTLDGEICNPAHLKPGSKLRVTMHSKNPEKATRIEALFKNTAFANDYQEGKVVRLKDNRLVMVVDGNDAEQVGTLSEDAEISCDGVPCDAAVLAPGMRIRIFADQDDANSVGRIEALRNNSEFASRTQQ